MCKPIIYMRKKNNNTYIILLIAVIFITASLFTAFRKSDKEVCQDKNSLISGTSDLPYELPRLNNHQPEQVIEHLGYTVSYNPQWLVPNWVAYELTNSETFGEFRDIRRARAF